MTPSLSIRIAKAEAWSLLFVAGLETVTLAACWLYRLHRPNSAVSWLLAEPTLWKLLAVCGGAVALLFGGPCYLVCRHWMKSRGWPLFLAGAVIALGALTLSGMALISELHDGCGG